MGIAASPERPTELQRLRLHLLAPIPAIVVGLAIAASQGVRWTAYAPNLVAVLLGMGTVLAARRCRLEALEAWAPTLAAVGIATTLLHPGVDGVTRWLQLGGLQLHASAALAPWLLLGLGAPAASARKRALVAALAVQLVHWLQPDAAQASALAAGSIAILLVDDKTPRIARLTCVLHAGAAALTWRRPDPLAPVEHVERVFYLAIEQGPGWLAACATTTGLLLFALVNRRLSWPLPPLACAALCYFTASVLATFFGHFPVPVLGAGFASVLGWYALLAVSTFERRPGFTDTPAV